MKSVYCAVRNVDLSKAVCAESMMTSVYCAVRTGDLNKAVCASSLKGFVAAFCVSIDSSVCLLLPVTLMSQTLAN
jgi:hypothetical protein